MSRQGSVRGRGLTAGTLPTGSISKSRSGRWSNASKDEQIRQEIDEMIKSSEYYDPSSHRTRKRRAFIRADFEAACGVLYGMTTQEEYWKKEEIIKRQKEYLAYYVKVSLGQLGDTIKGC